MSRCVPLCSHTKLTEKKASERKLVLEIFLKPGHFFRSKKKKVKYWAVCELMKAFKSEALLSACDLHSHDL